MDREPLKESFPRARRDADGANRGTLVVARHVEDVSRTAATELIRAGRVSLAGHAVRFAREAGGEWEKSFADDDDGDAAWLEDLEADMDLAALLDSEAVEPGDSWSLDAGAFSSILRAGGGIERQPHRPGDPK